MTMPLTTEEHPSTPLRDLAALDLAKEQAAAAIEERAKAFEELAANERLLPQLTLEYDQTKTATATAKDRLSAHKKRHTELLRQIKVAQPRSLRKDTKLKPKSKKAKKDKKPKAAKVISTPQE